MQIRGKCPLKGKGGDLSRWKVEKRKKRRKKIEDGAVIGPKRSNLAGGSYFPSESSQ